MFMSDQSVFDGKTERRTKGNKSNQKGQSVIEYLIIIALIGVGSMALLRSLSQMINVKFAQVAESLGARVEGDKSAPAITESMTRKKDMQDFFSGAKSRDEK